MKYTILFYFFLSFSARAENVGLRWGDFFALDERASLQKLSGLFECGQVKSLVMEVGFSRGARADAKYGFNESFFSPHYVISLSESQEIPLPVEFLSRSIRLLTCNAFGQAQVNLLFHRERVLEIEVIYDTCIFNSKLRSALPTKGFTLLPLYEPCQIKLGLNDGDIFESFQMKEYQMKEYDVTDRDIKVIKSNGEAVDFSGNKFIEQQLFVARNSIGRRSLLWSERDLNYNVIVGIDPSGFPRAATFMEYCENSCFKDKRIISRLLLRMSIANQTVWETAMNELSDEVRAIVEPKISEYNDARALRDEGVRLLLQSR